MCNNGCAAFQNSNNISAGNVSLSQSIPNPTSGSAVINYSINIPFTNAFINVSDNSGKLIKQFSLPQQQGLGSITFDGQLVSAAAYSYSLVIDGKVYNTKIMVIVKD